MLVDDNKEGSVFGDWMVREGVMSKEDWVVEIVLKKDKLKLSVLNKESKSYWSRVLGMELDK